MKKKTIAKSAKTGKIVSKEFAKNNPDITFEQQAKEDAAQANIEAASVKAAAEAKVAEAQAVAEKAATEAAKQVEDAKAAAIAESDAADVAFDAKTKELEKEFLIQPPKGKDGKFPSPFSLQADNCYVFTPVKESPFMEKDFIGKIKSLNPFIVIRQFLLNGVVADERMDGMDLSDYTIEVCSSREYYARLGGE